MDTIIIYGNKKDKQIRESLQKLLSKKFNVNYISDSVINSGSFGSQLNIIETTSLNEINIKNAILIVKNDSKINSISYIDKTTNIIVNANNTKSLLRLGKSNHNVYTCGFSSKDYVTFSSFDDESAIVSLQRSIKQLNGSICEPMEIPCDRLNGINDYTILATVLVMILLDKVDDKKISF